MKTVKKLISLAVMLAFVAGVAAIGLSGYVKLNAEKYILEADEAGEGYDCILVLGCKVNGDSPSLMLSRLVQSKNAKPPTVVRLSGSSMLTRLVQP